MKTTSIHKERHISASLIIALLALGAALALLTSCAETGTVAANSSTGKVRQATTCPQCKMVAVTAPQPLGPSFGYGRPATAFGAGYRWGGLDNGFGWSPTGFWYTTYEDKCPGCKGTVKTFFAEDKWKHKCTVCEQRPFTRPIAHRA